MARTDIYQTFWLEAGAIKLGHAQNFIVQQAIQNRILHSVHVVRQEKGDDVVLMIFEDEAHAIQFGRGPSPLPPNITVTT